jgi:tetratricopeptide (TPR) repeat protein
LAAYLKFYEQQWSELMASDHLADAPLQDYPERSVWTTWAISYQAIRERHEHTANLLLLWSFLDNKDLWYGLFAAACADSLVAARILSGWIGDIASSEIEFSRAIQLLCNYSLVEQGQETGSYAMHAVVHRWALNFHGTQSAMELSQLAVLAVGLAIPSDTAYHCSAGQRRLMPHVQACFPWVVKYAQKWILELSRACETCSGTTQSDEVLLEALYLMGLLCVNQGKLEEADQMYQCALHGQKTVLGPKHKSTLTTMNDLGVLYQDQQQLHKAKLMYKRALRERAIEFGQNETSTLETVNNLATLFEEEGKPDFAERMYIWALRGKEQTLGPNHISTLHTTNNLGALYAKQGKLSEAQRMFERALEGYENSLCNIRIQQYLPALDALENIGNLHAMQGEHCKAYAAFSGAFLALEGHLGKSSDRCKQLLCKTIAAFLQQANEQ